MEGSFSKVSSSGMTCLQISGMWRIEKLSLLRSRFGSSQSQSSDIFTFFWHAIYIIENDHMLNRNKHIHTCK